MAPAQDQEQDRDLFGDDDGDMYAGMDAGDVKEEEYNLAGPSDQVSYTRSNTQYSRLASRANALHAVISYLRVCDTTIMRRRERTTATVPSNTASRLLTGERRHKRSSNGPS